MSAETYVDCDFEVDANCLNRQSDDDDDYWQRVLGRDNTYDGRGEQPYIMYIIIRGFDVHVHNTHKHCGV